MGPRRGRERERLPGSPFQSAVGIRRVSALLFGLFLPSNKSMTSLSLPVSRLCLSLPPADRRTEVISALGEGLVLKRDKEGRLFAVPSPEVTLFSCKGYTHLSWKVWHSLPAFCHNLTASEICGEFQDPIPQPNHHRG